MTKIEWTEKTWNPILGCRKVSAGCENCYAIRMARRLSRIESTSDKYHELTIQLPNTELNWTGFVTMDADALEIPTKRKKPTTYFVCSMGDLFYQQIEWNWIDSVMDIIMECPQHTFQILTKRPEIAAVYFAYRGCPDNMWIGTSVENQDAANKRIPWLKQINAKVRFLFCEPLLAPISFDGLVDYTSPEIHWVIVGGESGPNARPMHPEWVQTILEQCQHIPFFFKQWGHYKHWSICSESEKASVSLQNRLIIRKESALSGIDTYLPLGKKKAGRLFHEKEYNEMPKLT